MQGGNIMENKMFCFQCQETLLNKGCTQVGVCGKQSSTSNLQDILIDTTKTLAKAIMSYGKVNDEIYDIISENLFITITNANFDDEMITKQINKTIAYRQQLSSINSSRMNYTLEDYALNPVGVLSIENEDIQSLVELITYGLKGLAAYNKHAHALGKRDQEIDIFLCEALTALLEEELTVDGLVSLVMKTGEYGVKGMSLLDNANTSKFGHPEITKVNIGVRKNPAILVSGHDLNDLEMLLKQTQGTGVDVYTHSEMLPAHYYPHFKQYENFVGNYGNAWWKQKEEFESFNGPILLTTNCLVPPKASYKERIYTTGAVGFDGCTHIEMENGNKDFSSLIEHAKQCLPPKEIETGEIIGGFAHHQVFALADKVVEAIKEGSIKKFVVMAGCDGRQKSRNYYTDFASSTPKDTVILTAGCAKYKYNKLDLGDINGIPRVLDAGQCNDSYSLALIALKLKEVFELEDINDLPIVYNIAWYEQKAVIVLLALLSLGVKNIHLGPTLPAFLSPNIVDFLVKNFNISGIDTVEKDIETFFDVKATFNSEMLVSDIVQNSPHASKVLFENGMGCMGCPASLAETLAQACEVHGLDVNDILKQLNEVE